MTASILVLVGWLAACSGTESAHPSVAPAPAPPSAPPPSPPPAPAPPPIAPAGPPGPLPAADRPIGTAHPYVLMGVSAERRWAVVCEARADTDGDGAIEVRRGIHGETRGDAMLPYLVLGEGEGEPIDDLVASDPTGRWLAIRRGEALVLVDAATGRRDELDADASDDGSPFGGYRGGSFDAEGRLFAYARRRGEGHVIVVRRLETGVELEIDPGPGQLHRSFVDEAGLFVVAEVVAADTDHDGQVTPPRPATSLGPRVCRGPIGSYSTSGMHGDAPETRVARLGEERARAVSGLVRAFGERLVRRREDGALGVETWGGAFEEWAPAGCHAQLLAMFPSADRLLVGCDDLGSPHHAFAEPGRLVPLEMGERNSAIAPQEVRARLHVAYTERSLDVADLSNGQVRHRRGANFVAVHGERVLSWEGQDLVSWDLDTDQRVRVRIGSRATGGFARQGALVAFAHVLYDLGADRLVGRYSGEPLAVSRDAHVLESLGPAPADAYLLPVGPLTWHPPSP